MSAKSDRRAARETVGAYHVNDELTELLLVVKLAVERHEAGEIDALAVDELIFRYSRAAKELWKFCNMGHVEATARVIREEQPGDWWDRGARRRG